ncbi:MAG: oligosaccharide flippase family protein, partial [Selenomonas sp.]|nr:oligosaccharide flippase family protein [Selenomonas sp.]
GLACVFIKYIDVVLLLCVFPSLLGNVLFPIWYYQGVQQMKFITWFNIIARAISVVGIFALVNNTSDYYLAAFLQAITPLLAGIISLVILMITHRELFCLPLWSDISDKYSEGWEIFISTIFINLYTNSNIVILRILTNDTCVGYYSAANKIIEVLKGAMMPISNAIFPHVSVLVQKSQKEAIIFLRKAVRIIGGVSFVLSGSMFLMADFVVQLIMGGAYTDSVQILRIISCLPFIIGLSNVFGIQTMVAFGMQTLFSRILMLSAMLNFILVFPMVYFWQSIGMAITVVLVECFVTITMYLALYKKGIKLFDNC